MASSRCRTCQSAHLRAHLNFIGVVSILLVAGPPAGASPSAVFSSATGPEAAIRINAWPGATGFVAWGDKQVALDGRQFPAGNFLLINMPRNEKYQICLDGDSLMACWTRIESIREDTLKIQLVKPPDLRGTWKGSMHGEPIECQFGVTPTGSSGHRLDGSDGRTETVGYMFMFPNGKQVGWSLVRIFWDGRRVVMDAHTSNPDGSNYNRAIDRIIALEGPVQKVASDGSGTPKATMTGLFAIQGTADPTNEGKDDGTLDIRLER